MRFTARLVGRAPPVAGRRLARPHTPSSPALGIISGASAWIGVTAKGIVGNATTAGRSRLPFIWARR
jgi:hypothetical protein